MKLLWICVQSQCNYAFVNIFHVAIVYFSLNVGKNSFTGNVRLLQLYFFSAFHLPFSLPVTGILDHISTRFHDHPIRYQIYKTQTTPRVFVLTMVLLHTINSPQFNRGDLVGVTILWARSHSQVSFWHYLRRNFQEICPWGKANA